MCCIAIGLCNRNDAHDINDFYGQHHEVFKTNMITRIPGSVRVYSQKEHLGARTVHKDDVGKQSGWYGDYVPFAH